MKRYLAQEGSKKAGGKKQVNWASTCLFYLQDTRFDAKLIPSSWKYKRGRKKKSQKHSFYPWLIYCATLYTEQSPHWSQPKNMHKFILQMVPGVFPSLSDCASLLNNRHRITNVGDGLCLQSIKYNCSMVYTGVWFQDHPQIAKSLGAQVPYIKWSSTGMGPIQHIFPYSLHHI